MRRPALPGIEVRAEGLRILTRVAAGAHADALLAGSGLSDERDRSLLREIVLGVLRRRAALDAEIARHSRRPVEEIDPPVLEALRLAAYQILYLDRVPAPAAVNTAVELVKRRRGAGAAAFANGVLRALGRGRTGRPRPPATAGDPVARLALAGSTPTWLARRWVGAFGAGEAARLMEANNRPPPTSVLPVLSGRLPAARDGRDLAADLAREGIETVPSRWVPGALRIARGRAADTRAFSSGRFYIQDEASMLVARLAFDPSGGTLLDLCAAPGGKSLTIPSGRVVAADRSAARLGRLRDNAERLSAAGFAVVRSDASNPPFREGTIDRVLVDAPCTGTGVIRRHPEIRWRLSDGDPARMAREQAEMLSSASRLVAPGGLIVYAVCSLEREEGEGVVEAFLSAHPEWRLSDSRSVLPGPSRVMVRPEGWLRTWPHRQDLDGHFAARLERRPSCRSAPGSDKMRNPSSRSGIRP